MEHVAEKNNSFHDILQSKIDAYVDGIYGLTRQYPKDELFGATSQHRRAALSIALNYVEGYARIKNKVQINFLEIAFGSLKESQYLLTFAKRRKWITQENFTNIYSLGDELAAMLWSTMRKKA